MDIGKFEQLPLVGILRGIKEESVDLLVETVVSAGLKTIEVTMNTASADKIIARMVKASAGDLTIGAGTVLCMKDLHSALDAGATFIVMPTLIQDVTAYCVKNNIPVFPGAFTPQEIHNAWLAGASMVKIFPSSFFGPTYFKEIKGPFNDIPLLACGGVNSKNIGEFFANGASAAAFGGSVFNLKKLEKGDVNGIKRDIEDLIAGLL
ncbi:bifunctional 4-hydroxy-2-oxoglutarate aldolase/2-dehydro-3-deoxy-phosphogluconate aldolase [bacterium]|nr:bifunctional 4-hydroxy-2-oxoglutarate aldolase/2-dehydro-3-deoxy-phosphogluconate aldolase [bacterium]